ncbi:MAG: hypothetical protein ACRDJN_03130, partial [Chloroflexota bacterium]
WPEDQVPANPGRALYWNVSLPHAGRTWKLDIFGLGPATFRDEQARFAALRRDLAGLTAAERLAVLRIKRVVRRPEYGRKVCSVALYEAVARDGIRTVTEFEAWLQHRPEALDAVQRGQHSG